MLKSPDQAIEAIKSATTDVPVVIDFDETLFLRNSTEEYLRSIYPRTLGIGFVLTMRKLKPWRFLPQHLSANNISQDWFLVVTATLLFPWTSLVWQWRAKKLAKQYCNLSLAQAIDSSQTSQLVIATLGFDWVLRPLLRQLPVAKVQDNQYRLVACRFWQGAMDRAKGKLAMVTEVIGSADVSRSVVVTDREADMPILSASAQPYLVQWPGALFWPAISDAYIPLFYSRQLKGWRYAHLFEHVILSHWLFLVFASSLVSSSPALHALSLLLLTLSYWCVYEIGYQEEYFLRDQSEKEVAPLKTVSLCPTAISLSSPWPWLWATSLAIPACFLLSRIQLATPETAALSLSPIGWSAFALYPDGFLSILVTKSVLWLAFLGAVRLTLLLYHRFDEEARMWLYPVLQTQKMFGFAMLVTISQVGAILLMSVIISRWIEYCIYRCEGHSDRFPTSVSTLLVFTLLFAGAVTGSADPEHLLSWQAIAIFGMCFCRSFKTLQQVITHLDLVVNSRRNRAAKESQR